MTNAHQDHRQAWELDSMVEKFAHKGASDFFRSETHFMSTIASARSVLDVGCASGRLAELLGEYLQPGFSFTGIDVVPASIERATANYPEHDFHVADYLETEPAGPFDFINATGVVQHEPRYRELITRMVDDAARWVLFDAKVAPTTVDLIDRDRSHVNIEGTRLYFNVLAYEPFSAWLASLPSVAGISILGYRTEPNARTVVPPDLGPFASIGVLLTLGGSGETPTMEVDLPDFLVAPTTEAASP